VKNRTKEARIIRATLRLKRPIGSGDVNSRPVLL
jgi:hypothetical protein